MIVPEEPLAHATALGQFFVMHHPHSNSTIATSGPEEAKIELFY
jgi:hypothetical protein